MGGLSERQRSKLTQVLKMPLAENSHELVTLRCQDGSTLEIRKALLAMLSRVLSEALRVEPACCELKVKGNVDDWQRLLSLVLCTEVPNPDPQDVKKLMPIAHLYNMESAMHMLSAPVDSFKFSLYAHASGYADPMYVLTWLELAGKYEAPELGMACAKFILSQMSDSLFSQAYPDYKAKRELLSRFSPSAVHTVCGPPDIVRFLAVAVKAQAARMGMTI